MLRDLAQRLHRHHLGAVKFTQGIESKEIASVLATVAVDVGRRERPIGMESPDFLTQWTHIRLLPMTFEQLQLLDEQPADAKGGSGGGSGDGPTPNELRNDKTTAAALWIGLARAALSSETATVSEEDVADPMVVAKAINERPRDVAYDQVVVGYLLQIAEELKKKGGGEAVALQKRISNLVGGLEGETIRRLLAMGNDATQRRKFMLDATQGMAVEAVLDLVKAASKTDGQNVSNSMLRLLSKLAVHADHGPGQNREQADTELRVQVSKLVTDWDLEDPNPDAYRLALDRMASETPMFTGIDQFPCEPERLLAMGFEIEMLGEPVWRAVDELAARADFTPLLELLDAAPPGWIRDTLWHYVASPERLHAVLQRAPINFGLVHRLVARMRLAAVEPLLDAIENADDRTASSLIDILAGMGVEIGGFITSRLASARWPLLRTFLAVLGRLPEWPADFQPREYVRHPDNAVRREALRILLKSPSSRDDAITQAVSDPDERLVRLALGAAMNNCPAQAASVLMLRATDEGLSADLRALGVRVLASHKSSQTVRWLVDRTLGKKRFFFGRQLAVKSPEMLAALSGLAAHWRTDAAAAPVLTLARRSTDPEIADAVAIRGGEE